jgi:AI-2 transport protein TqsA
MKNSIRDELTWLTTGCLMILAVVAIAIALIYTRAVMIPFVLAVFIVTVVSPIVDYQVVRFKLPRSVAIGVALLFVLAVLAIFGVLSIVAIEGMVADIREFTSTLNDLNKHVFSPMADRLAEWDIHVDETKIAAEVQGMLPGMVTRTVGKATGLLSTGFLIAIFVVFLLSGRKSPAKKTGIYAEIESRTRRYIATKFVISAVTGLLVGGILWAFGLPMAALFGMLAFALNFIPSIGSVVATLLPVPVAFAHFGGNFWVVLAVVACPGSVHMIIGNVIEPKLMGHGMKLHPATVLFSLAFWGLLWGPLGMVLAVPITATIRIILMRFTATKPIGDLLAGKLPEEGTSESETTAQDSAPAY